MENYLIGAHVSAVGGIQFAPKRAKDIGCNAVQIFCSSPRVWAKTLVKRDNIEAYKVAAPAAGMEATVIHAQYLINLASPDPVTLGKSQTSVYIDLEACHQIKARGVVVHLGSHLGRGFDAVKEQMVKQIAQALERTGDDAILLIENSAGQQGKIASDLREIRWLLDALQAGKRVGWCLDSCHAYAAGYSLIPMEGEKYLFDWIAELHLQDTLRVVHVNDTRDPYVSHKDRHANLYEGDIGKEMMREFVRNPLFAGLPMILEVPGMDGESGPDKENVTRLRDLLH